MRHDKMQFYGFAAFQEGRYITLKTTGVVSLEELPESIWELLS